MIGKNGICKLGRLLRHHRTQKGDSFLAEVILRDNESLDAALRRFTRRVQQDGILAEARRRGHYEKPSVKRKRKLAQKRRKSLKNSSR